MSINELLIKYLDKECSPEEQLNIQQWLREKPENIVFFKEFRETWLITRSYNHEFTPDLDAAWLNVLGKIEQKELKKPKRDNSFKIYYRAAAIIFAVVSIYLSYTLLFEAPTGTYIELANQSQELQKIDLPDGSKVWLSKSSVIKYSKDFNSVGRDVILSGEAFFEVVKDPERPFTVTGMKTVVKVLGTTFVYRSFVDENNDKLIVNTGKVSFTEKENSSNNVTVESGYIADFNKSTRVIEKAEKDSKSFFAKKTGRLIFENERFENIISSLSKFYDRNYYIKDEKLKEIRLTIAFNNQPIEEALQLLGMVMDRKITDSSQTIVIY